MHRKGLRVFRFAFFDGLNFLRLIGTDQKEVNDDSHCVQAKGENQDVLITARCVDDDLCDLVARKPCDAPRGKRDAVDGRNLAHAVHVGKEGRQVAKTTAVAKIYDDKKGYADEGDTVRNRAREQGERRQNKLGCQNDFINRVSILQVVADRGITKSACSVEEAHNATKDRRGRAEAYCRQKRFFVGNEGKTAGDIDIEHQPNTDKFHVAEDFETGEEGFDIHLFVRFHPTVGLFQKQVADEHHNEPNASQKVECVFRAHHVQKRGDDGGKRDFRRAEACNRQTRCKTLVVLEPKHQRFDGGEVAKTKPDAHQHAVAKEYERHAM